MVIFFRSSIRSMRGSSEESSTCNFPWYHMFYGSFFYVFFLWYNSLSLGIQSYSQLMIGMSNHILSRVFGFHYRSQKVIGSLPRVYSCLGYIHWNSCIFNNWGEMTPVTCFQGHKKGVRTPFFGPQLVGHGAWESWDQGLNKMVIFFRSSIRSMRGSSEESSTCNFPWYHMFYGSFFYVFLNDTIVYP